MLRRPFCPVRSVPVDLPAGMIDEDGLLGNCCVLDGGFVLCPIEIVATKQKVQVSHLLRVRKMYESNLVFFSG